MRLAMALSGMLLVISIQHSFAIDLRDCTKVNGLPETQKCFQENQKQIVDELARVSQTADATKGVADTARQKAGTAQTTAADAKTAANNAQNAASSALHSEDKVQIRSIVVPGKCIDQRSNPEPQPHPDKVMAVTCADADPENRWILRRYN